MKSTGHQVDYTKSTQSILKAVEPNLHNSNKRIQNLKLERFQVHQPAVQNSECILQRSCEK